MSGYEPPFCISNSIVNLLAEISEQIGRIAVLQLKSVTSHLRKGNRNEIKEVQNAYQAYELMLKLNPYSVDDLLRAHRLVMQDLIKEAGKFWSGADKRLN